MITIEETSQNLGAKKVRIKKGCDNCENAIICKYKLEFQDCIEGLESMDLSEVVFMDVSCKYHKGGEVSVKKMDMQGREYRECTPNLLIRRKHKDDRINEKSVGDEI